MRNVKILLEEAGAKLDHICKITVYITDRAYRDPVYRVMAMAEGGLSGIHRPESSRAWPNPSCSWKIDVDAVIPEDGA